MGRHPVGYLPGSTAIEVCLGHHHRRRRACAVVGVDRDRAAAVARALGDAAGSGVGKAAGARFCMKEKARAPIATAPAIAMINH